MAKISSRAVKVNMAHATPENAGDVPSAYVNNMEVLGLSPFDLRIAFNEVQSERSGGVKITRKANLVMSLPHFLATVELLNKVASDVIKQAKAASPQS